MGRFAAVGCFASLLGLGLPLLGAAPAIAQNQRLVIRDGELGGVVAPGFDDLGEHADYLIRADLGEQHGANLFHSFSKFSIGSSEAATFTAQGAPDPGGIDHVISRVTGGEASQIDGKLRSTISGADLWLLNPSGVMFGAGAELDVSGSFHASTGDYVGFGEGELVRFYARDDPMRPSVLSTARPEAFGFLEESTPGPIALEPGATLGTEMEGAVGPGQRLSLVGGNVTLTDAEIVAPGAHVHLEAQGDVALTRSTVDVSGEAPGSVSIRGGRLVMRGGADRGEQRSLVLAENEGAGDGGSIEVEASESVLVDNSLISVNTTSSEASDESAAATIHVASPSVTFQRGPGFFDLDDIENNVPHPTEVGASAETGGSGAGGTIAVDAGRLVLTDGASVSARSYGLDATGDAGRIHILADSVKLSAGSDISTGTWGSQGDAGRIDIDVANDLVVNGSEDYAAIWASSSNSSWGLIDDPGRVLGAPGAVDISADWIEVTNGGSIESGCFDCTSKLDDAGRPDGAGTIEIRAASMEVAGANSILESTVLAASGGDGGGDAGSILVDVTGTLKLRDGAGITAHSRSRSGGNAGEIEVHADFVLISGHIPPIDDGPISAGIRAFSESTGRAGTIEVFAREVAIEAGGIINANSGHDPLLSGIERTGEAGDITITARESISVSNEGGQPFSLIRALSPQILREPQVLTGVFAATVLGGEGGSIALEAPEITVSHGALVASSTVGGGDGGTVRLEGENIRIVDGGNVNGVSLPFYRDPAPPILGGRGGGIELSASETIEVAGLESTVSAATFSAGPAGNVTLVAPRIVIEDDGTVETTALRYKPLNAGNARAGDITIDATDQVIVRGGGLVDASSFVRDPEEGVSSGGNVVVTAGRSIRVEGAGSRIESRTGGPGTGGDIALHAPRIEIRDHGTVSARSTPGYQGVGFAILEEDGLIPPAPETARGDAGAVWLSANQLRLVDGGTLAVNSKAADGGNLTVEAKALVHLDRGVITSSVTDGAGGNITIDPEVVILQNGSKIVAEAGDGSGGRIRITADNYFAFPGTVVSAEANDQRLSGTVEVNTPDVNLAGALAELPSNPLDAASQMKEPCAARRSGERAGSFAVRGAEGIPPEPDGWLPATVAPEGTNRSGATPSEARLAPPILLGTSCP